jgi:large subunit ribosomal protein L9
MKVILLEDVKSLGKKGQIVDINDGYARNFVLPKKLGIEANNSNLNDLKLKNANDAKIAQEQLDNAKAFAEAMEKDEVVVSMKAGEGGKTFGSVSSKEIALAYKEQCGKDIDKKKIQLAESIRNFGVYEVAVKLHPKVTGKLKVKVTQAK